MTYWNTESSRSPGKSDLSNSESKEQIRVCLASKSSLTLFLFKKFVSRHFIFHSEELM